MEANSHRVSIPEQANRLLRFVKEQFPRTVKLQVLYDAAQREQIFSSDVLLDDFQRVLDYMYGKKWIGRATSGFFITDMGYDHLEPNVSGASQAFVAMWFDISMNDVYENSIAPAIETAGYSPLRIDRRDFFGKIDDQIIAEIRRSRFIVADFSHGGDGVRGSVYYEAGFAHGLGMPFIYLCRKGSDLAFDTNHYPHIIWETPEGLREQLTHRILALIGQGPNPLPA